MNILLVATALTAASISFEVENFTAHSGISTIVLKVTNNSGQPARSVFIDCVFLDKDHKAIDIGKSLITDLAPGQTKYDKASITTTQGVEHAQCYVDQVR